MLLQISSGQGPAECKLAVKMLCEALLKEFPDASLFDVHGDYASAIINGPDELATLSGTIGWICKSPLRPHHKRKNWFIHASVVPELRELTRESDIIVQTFRSGGPGGQNVNKVATAVRIIHKATGLVVVCRDERSQKQNKERALARLWVKLAAMQDAEKGKQKEGAWEEHQKLVRGNPIRVYSGPTFLRIK